MSFLFSGGLFDVIPDSAIYRWSAENISLSNGQIADPWPEFLSGVDGLATNSPIYRTDQAGYQAVELNGTDDGYTWSPDAQMPTGSDPFAVFSTVYIRANDQTVYNVGNQNSGAGNAVSLSVRDNSAEFISEGDNLAGSTIPFNQWVTIGCSYDGSTRKIYSQGSLDGSESISMNIDNVSHSLGYRRGRNLYYWDGFISDVILCDTAESDQAFSDYHNSILG